MRKRFFFSLMLCAFALFAKAQYQFPNSDFESDFVTAYTSNGYTEPKGWHGYATLSGSALNATMGRSGEKLAASDDVREGATGTQCVYVKSTAIFGIVANGVMTNGQIYSGSVTATDGSKNYNFSDPTNIGDAGTYGDNTEFYTQFTGRPDYMKVWLKFAPAADDTGNARVSVYLHKEGTVMYDPTDNVEDMSIVIAHTEQAVPSNNGEWTQYTLSFDYDADGTLGYDGSATPGLILATFSTNETAGAGSANDYLYIDDIEMVYLSELASATYDGEEISFTDGEASIDKEYDASLLAYTLSGAGATAEVEEPSEENGNTLTITVKGNNISEDETNYHTYTIHFTQTSATVVSTSTYTDSLVITINEESTEPEEATVTVEYMSDGTANLILKNFQLTVDGTEMPVGNIQLEGIEITEGDEYQTITFDGTTQITKGDLSGVFFWYGPLLGDVSLRLDGKMTDESLYLSIDIDMTSLLQQVIHVEFGTDPDQDEEEEEGVEVVSTSTYTDSLVITINTDSTEPEEATVTVEYMSDGSANLILKNFQLVVDGSELPVGTIQLEGVEITDGDEYQIITFDGTTQITKGDLSGVFFWYGPLLGDVSLRLDGKMTDEKLYLTIDIDMKSLIGDDVLVTFGSDFDEEENNEPDAITSVSSAASAANAIYDLSGRKVSAPAKGIYIINGKKVLVK